MKRSVLYSLLLWLVPAAAFAECVSPTVKNTGVSGIWILANISYAGMRAQNHPGAAWRIAAFIFGFPGTLITFFAVKEGGERAYGIDIPRKREL
jgi:hypothetical protein